MEQENFIKIEKESFGTFTFIIFWPYWGAKFIIKKNQLK